MSTVELPVIEGAGTWTSFDPSKADEYQYLTDHLDPDKTVSGFGYHLYTGLRTQHGVILRFPANFADTGWHLIAVRGTDDEKRGFMNQIRVADGKDYAAVQELAFANPTFEQIAAIDWSNVPVAAGDHQKSQYLCSSIRNFDEFYKHNQVQRVIETWLTNYSATHAYRPEN